MKIIDRKSKLAVVAGGVAAGALALATAPAWRRRAAWSLGGLLLLWALAWAAVPPIVKSQLEKIASEKLGRQVTLGAVDFKPWSLELTLNDLAIAKRGPAAASAAPAAAQFTLKRLYIDAELSSLLRLAPVVDAISMEAPVLSLTHLGQGRYDIDDLLARLRSPDDGPASAPPRFALYNLVLSGGQIDFVDQPVGQTHALRALHLSVPFLSNLASQREVKIAPHLAFTLNGSRFDSAAEGTPFARTRKTDATLKFSRLDLSPYLAYWPSGLPVRLQAAMLQADLKLAFEQTPASVVRLSGSVSADQVRALDTHSPARELLAFERLQVQLDDVRPLAQFVKLSQVTLTAPTLNLTRDPAGRLNLLPPAVQGGQGAHDAPEKIAADADSVRDGGQKEAMSALAVVMEIVPALHTNKRQVRCFGDSAPSCGASRGSSPSTWWRPRGSGESTP